MVQQLVQNTDATSRVCMSLQQQAILKQKAMLDYYKLTNILEPLLKKETKVCQSISHLLILGRIDPNSPLCMLPLEILHMIIKYAHGQYHYFKMPKIFCFRCQSLKRGRCTCDEMRQEVYDQYMVQILEEMDAHALASKHRMIAKDNLKKTGNAWTS